MPVVTGVSPASGPLAGGGTVTLSGSGFPATGVPRVLFGSVVASVQSTSADSIVVTVPPAHVPARTKAFAGAATVDVSVTDPAGSAGSGEVSSLPSPAARYEYLAVAPGGGSLPTVTGLAPQGGVPAGGTRVIVYGDGFRAAGGVTSVTFGGVPASFSVVSDGEIVVTTPHQQASTSCSRGAGFDPAQNCQVEVVVSDAQGASSTAPIAPAVSGAIRYDSAGLVRARRGREIAESSTEYDYAALPVITSITPDPINVRSSAPVTIRGRNFSLLTLEWVDFGPVDSTDSQQVKFTDVSSDEIVVYPPPAPAPAGATPERLPGGVTVQTVSGPSNTAAFSYSATS